MKRYAFFTCSLIFLFLVFGAEAAVTMKTTDFIGMQVKDMVINKDIEGFLKKIPDKNMDVAFRKNLLHYVFGNSKNDFSVRQFLLKKRMDVYIQPFLDSKRQETGKFLLIFYDRQKIDFKKKVTQKELERGWNKVFVETEIWIRGSDWYFGEAIFDFASGPSWNQEDDSEVPTGA